MLIDVNWKIIRSIERHKQEEMDGDVHNQSGVKQRTKFFLLSARKGHILFRDFGDLSQLLLLPLVHSTPSP